MNKVVAEIDSALKDIEQECQTLRWRITNFDDVQAIRHLETEIGAVTGLACKVARLYGQFEALVARRDACDVPQNNDDIPTTFDSEIVGLDNPILPPDEGQGMGAVVRPETHETPVSGPELDGTCSDEKSYNVIPFFCDTEIVEIQGGGGEYLMFEPAKAAAIEYLEDIIDQCEFTIDGLRDADTPEQYFGPDVFTSDCPKTECNVQYICPGHYQPDPEVQGKPLSWFLGKLVKMKFPVSGCPDCGELMWVAVTSIRGDELVGTLTNEPVHADQSYGDEIVFRREEVFVVDEVEMVA